MTCHVTPGERGVQNDVWRRLKSAKKVSRIIRMAHWKGDPVLFSNLSMIFFYTLIIFFAVILFSYIFQLSVAFFITLIISLFVIYLKTSQNCDFTAVFLNKCAKVSSMWGKIFYHLAFSCGGEQEDFSWNLTVIIFCKYFFQNEMFLLLRFWNRPKINCCSIGVIKCIINKPTWLLLLQRW